MKTRALIVVLSLLSTRIASAFDLDTLMVSLAARGDASATFVEEQHLKSLDRPLRASGELRYEAPATLIRRTIEPREELLRYEAGVLSTQRGNRRTTFDVQRYPQALPFVESLRATLAGDRAALERLFDATLSGEADHWRLRLVPRETQARKLLREIRVEGRRDDVVGFVLERENGDRTVTTMTPAPR
ncbi:MAG: LolA-related protein [Steroidobacteraceae bacterium]